MIELNRDNFDAEVFEHQGAVLVDFWSPKCEPCMALLPLVEAMAEEYAGKVKFCKVNTLENRRLCIAQKVMGIPTFFFVKDGQKLVELNAETATEANIRAELAKLL
ncbi:MAG: thioredoxin family protein [Symbiobacteriaceae bacterium]|nr:thioredoxin family protein [Symbiobacteriaceae bacterium]